MLLIHDIEEIREETVEKVAKEKIVELNIAHSRSHLNWLIKNK